MASGKIEKFNLLELANRDACFDLQFRKDTRHERTGSPTYYRWKLQFVITGPKDSVKIMERIEKEFGCGDVSTTAGQARFSVQKIDDIYETIVPYFTKNALTQTPSTPLRASKKKDFDLWRKAVEIIYKNKGKYLAAWEKNDLKKLIEIHKTKSKYKQKPRAGKWMSMAQALARS